ncbi:MAG: flippase [Deltaproteobacteria bacterium]|nr:flippase [Deltaproteobacteria bacterium]
MSIAKPRAGGAPKPENGVIMTTPRFVRNSALLLAVEIITKTLGVVFFALIARFLGAGEVGLYAFALAVANFIVIPARFGFENLVQREVGREPATTRHFLWGVGAVKGLISLGILGLFCIALALTGRQDLTILLLAAGFTVMFSFMEFLNAFFRANQKPEFELAVRLLFSLSNLLLGLLVLYAGWRLRGVLLVQLINVTVAVIIGTLILARIAPPGRCAWHWRAVRGYVVAATPFAGILVSLYFSNQIGVIVLKLFTGSTEVGYFAAALRLFDSLTLIPAAIMGAFLPIMSQLYVRSVGGFARTLRFTLKCLFILSVPLVVIMAILARPIVVFLYGQSFLPSAPALQILSLPLLFSFWNYACTNVLIARNEEGPLLRLTWLTAGIHVTANLLFISAFSYLGACLAILTTQGIFGIILYGLQLRRYLRVGGLVKLMASPVLSGTFMGLAVLLARDWNLLLSISLGLLVYVGGILALGTLSREEMDRLPTMVASGPSDLPETAG